MRKLCLIALFWLGSNAVALGQADPGQEALEAQQKAEAARAAAAASQGGNALPQAPDLRPVAEAQCFPIDNIEVSGTSKVAPKSLKSLVARFENQCLGQVSIGKLINGISALYAEEGLITTRAYVPAQDIASRKLKVDVLEGRIESFVYQTADEDGKGVAGPARKVIWSFPGQPGEVFQLRDLEHGLESMNRLSSIKASANLQAGLAPGTTRVVIAEKKEDPIRGTFSLDNGGSEDTGRERVKFSLEMDDLLRLNDNIALSYSGTENTNALAFSASLPRRYWRFLASGSYSESLSELSPVSDLFTQNASLNFQIERMLYRDDRVQASIYGVVGSSWNQRYINIVGPTPQKHSSLRLGWKLNRQFEKASLSADIAIASGSRLFGADWDTSDLPPDAPNADFTKIDYALSYQRSIGKEMRIAFSLTGQSANSALFSGEQLTVGGWSSVRGFEGKGVAGDSGFYLRTDFYFPPIRFGEYDENDKLDTTRSGLFGLKGTAQPYAFLDYGEARTYFDGNITTFSGFGVGIVAQTDKVSIQVALAIPGSNGFNVDSRNIQGFLNVSLKLF